MRRILACVVLAAMVMGCDGENASDEEKPSEAQKSSEVEKPSEVGKSSEVEKPSEAIPTEAEAKKAFEDGVAAYKRGDYAAALRFLEPIAKLGAAPAQLTVGLMYAQGLGVPQDYTEALKWYRLAADQGVANAQINLGNMYLQGIGVLPNEAEAAKWFRRAAEQGDAKAQNNLGIMCATGKGVPQDTVQAYKWFSLAASSDQPEDRSNGVKNRDRVASQMTQEQIAQAQKLAQEWKPTSAATAAQ
jgi:TPR repeat protein